MKKLIKKLIKKLCIVKKEKVLIPVLEGHYLDNRCALITGGSSGIGYSIAESFIKNGASVIIVGRSEKKLASAKDALIKKLKCDEERIDYKVIDISDVKNIDKNINDILSSANKKIDILVNSAGVNVGDYFPNTTEEDYDKVLDTNLKGTYFISQVIAKYMVNNKIQGNILNITSSSALRPGISPYIISKWGERSLTLGLAKKYMKYGIIVNGIAPGSTSTPMVNSGDKDDLSCSYTLSKRFIAPEEIGNIATILVSDVGKMIIGDTIYATGGAGIITYDDMNY